MSSIFKSSEVNIDENKRVLIKNNGSPNSDFKEKTKIKTQSILNDTYKKSEEIILEAEEQAKIILKEASENRDELFEKIKVKGYEVGFNKGFEEGYLKSKEDNQKSKEKLEIEKKKIIQSAYDEKEEILNGIEPKIVEVMDRILKEVLDTSFQINSDLLLLLVKKGMDKATILNKAIINVSEHDYDYISSKKEDIYKNVDSQKEIEIVKNFSLEAGDCVIATEYGNISCGLGEQLENISNCLYQIMKNKNGESNDFKS